MVVGFVLIRTAPTRERDVYQSLLDVPGLVELHPLFGDHDLLAKVEAPSYDELGAIVVNGIRNVHGVVDTQTLTGMRF